MRSSRYVLSLVIAFGLAACSTPYQATFLSGGYSEKQLEADVWRVEFDGNGFTTQETVQTYWLYRSAQLALDKGYDGFEIVSSTSLVLSEPPSIQIAAAAGGGAHYTYHPVYIPMYTGGESGPKYTVIGDIRLLKAPIQAKPPKMFDAGQLKSTLDPYVNGQKCDMGNVCAHVHRYLMPDTQTARSGASSEAVTAAPPPLTPPPSVANGTPRITQSGAAAAASTSPPVSPNGPASGTASIAATPAVTPAAASQAISPQAPAMASTADFRCPQPGTLIRTSTGDQLRFMEAKGERCSYTDNTGDTRERYALFVDGFGAAAKSDLDRLWPLQVGNNVEYDVIDATPVQSKDPFLQKHYHESFEVLRQERVTVPAGTFDTFVVEWSEAEIGRNFAKTAAKVTLWYAPQIGYFVKSSADIVSVNTSDPFATTQYAKMTYQVAEVVMPDGTPIREDAKPAAAVTSAPSPPTAHAPTKAASSSSASTPAASGTTASPADRLIALKRLLDEKVITRQEYDERRKVILDGL
jgi:hypothetical protein